MIQILEIESGSIARELGIRPGAILKSINGREIEDQLDYRFYVAAERLEVLIEQDGEEILFDIEKNPQEDLGLVLEEMKMRKCGNKCIFCFVHQTPKGLRKTLYFKDEDYRFSFLYGHYVTLSNARRKDLERIVEQRLSPLYISVHATDPELRKYLLGIKHDDYLLQKIRYLTEHGIELHAQIVLCPGLNDGTQLDRTINDLKPFYPRLRSVAIVPVGLTRHRRNLPELNPVTNEYSLRLMEEMHARRRALKKELGTSFVYLSDESYIRTGQPVPEDDYYEGFYQLENGVGLTRDFLNRFREELPRLGEQVPEKELSLVSGVLGSEVLQKYVLPELAPLTGGRVKLHRVVNRFWGENITVSGLLVGQDIYRTLKEESLGEVVVLPPRVLNHDGLFLDDWTVADLEEKLGRPVFVFPESFLQLFAQLHHEQRREPGKDSPVHYVAEQMKNRRRSGASDS